MKSKIVLFLSTTSLLYAGNPDLETSLTTTKPEPWIKPTIDIRARYEYGDVDGFDQSHALTFRERLGLKTIEWNGLSAFIEGEFTQAAIDNYNSGAGPTAEPFDPLNTTIPDPETNEFNQGYIQYSGFDTVAKVGRQKIVYDNAAFIGNVGWRQNEQTFDAISFTNKSIDGLTFNYAFVNQVNRIFGSDADSPISAGPPPFTNVEYVGADVHLLNASYSGIKGLTLGGYAYIMNFEDLGAWDNNTFGISAKGNLGGIDLYGEFAYQDKAGTLGEGTATYAHTTATKTFGSQSITVGFESLGAGFKTPFATAHAFNGFADVTDGGRISGAHNGLSDIYLSHTTPLFLGIKWMNSIRALGDNDMTAGYGWEYDSVLTKKFDDNFTAIAKFAHFESEDDIYINNPLNAGLPTTSRFSIELNYTF
jgi:hypothetical protein